MNRPLHHPVEYFVDQYRDHDDPWGFDDRWYERRKYALTMAALPHRRYRRALEPGCANGALTELLSDRCDELIAHDLVPSAVDRARARLASQAHVTVRVAEFPRWLPPGRGDLLIWSEVGYYLTDDGLAEGLAAIDRWLEPGGTMIAVHYTGTTNYPRTADETHDAIGGLRFLSSHTAVRDEEFRLDVWQRRPTKESERSTSDPGR